MIFNLNENYLLVGCETRRPGEHQATLGFHRFLGLSSAPVKDFDPVSLPTSRSASICRDVVVAFGPAPNERRSANQSNVLENELESAHEGAYRHVRPCRAEAIAAEVQQGQR
jgi:hypothetical protein